MPDQDHSKLVKQHFERSYQDYDRLIPKLVPGYGELVKIGSPHLIWHIPSYATFCASIR